MGEMREHSAPPIGARSGWGHSVDRDVTVVQQQPRHVDRDALERALAAWALLLAPAGTKHEYELHMQVPDKH